MGRIGEQPAYYVTLPLSYHRDNRNRTRRAMIINGTRYGTKKRKEKRKEKRKGVLAEHTYAPDVSRSF